MNYKNACSKCRTGGLPKGTFGKATGTLGKTIGGGNLEKVI